MPKVEFTFSDSELSDILSKHISSKNLIPAGKYYTKIKVRPTGTAGFDTIMEFEEVNNNEQA